VRAPQAQAPEARAFEWVVDAVREFCPRIEILRPGICALGVRGPARYFGGEAELARKIVEAVTRLGFDCRVGIADGMFAALLAARTAGTSSPDSTGSANDGPAGGRSTGSGSPGGASAVGRSASGSLAGGGSAGGALPVVIVPSGESAEFLRPHPVGVLGQPELADLLSRLGIRVLGEFAALPAAEAASRFGAQGLLAHRLASGLDPRPLAARLPSADLFVQVEFDPAVQQAEPVVFAAKSLAGQMHSQLAARGLACVRMQVQVLCENGQEITRLWRHDGLLSELAVAERVRWQLDDWRTGEDARAGSAPDLIVGGSPLVPAAPDMIVGGSPLVPAGNDPRSRNDVGGIIALRLIPDQLVHDRGRQLGLWGDAVVSDRVSRAAVRVQAMLGPGAVRHPVLAGGRSPAVQALSVPFGDARVPRLPADRPWPGQIPAPAPATVYPTPRPAKVTDSSGIMVVVSGRGQVSASPARLSVVGEPCLPVTAWTGPWPVTERWWDPEQACRKARFQLVTVDGSAWLAVVQDGHWLIEASYD
jgi:protein ImuB